MIVVTISRCGLITTDDVRKASMVAIFKEMAKKGECVNNVRSFFDIEVKGNNKPHCLDCKHAKVRDKKEVTKNGNKDILCLRKVLLSGDIFPRGWIDEDATPPGWIKVNPDTEGGS